MREIKNNFDIFSISNLLEELENKEEFTCGLQVYVICNNCVDKSKE